MPFFFTLMEPHARSEGAGRAGGRGSRAQSGGAGGVGQAFATGFAHTTPEFRGLDAPSRGAEGAVDTAPALATGFAYTLSELRSLRGSVGGSESTRPVSAAANSAHATLGLFRTLRGAAQGGRGAGGAGDDAGRGPQLQASGRGEGGGVLPSNSRPLPSTASGCKIGCTDCDI